MPIDVTALAVLPFFAELTGGQRRALSQVLVERAYAPGEVIFAEGSRGMACAFIIRGTVHVELDAGPGRPAKRINSMGEGEIFGEVALLDGGRRTASCLAGEGGAAVALLSRDDFSLLFESGNPFAFSIARLIARQLARRLRHAAHVWSETTRGVTSDF